jgi:biopolymer transport protein ExbD
MAIGRLPDAGDDGGEGNESIFAEINITPLTDVFLVLLIIFMVSALAVQVEAKQEQKKMTAQQEKADDEKKSGIKVNLPSGQAQEIDPTKASLVLEIPLSGDVHVGGKIIGDDRLDNMFTLAYQHDKTTQVVLKADKGVTHGRVVNLMERAKKAGLVHLAIGTSGS